MKTLNAKHITLETLEKNLFNRVEFDEYMADFGKTTRNNYEMSVIEIIEDGEIVDYAHPISMTHSGQRFYDIKLSDMNTGWTLNGEYFDTDTDDINMTNYPIAFQRAMRTNRR